ncbi:MAG: acetoacetate--CoA ligase [Thaumarchaeota archaeon]|nr:acetoacetate--CoA ligase [Candidatus Calditenuaceae archaeon]MDW8186564.1 acetoacetate--CoA ligase [Nitrososphaerota archaeon]
MPNHKILWTPSEEDVRNSNIAAFIDFLNKRWSFELRGYFDVYDWSINNISQFWSEVWKFLRIKSSRDFDRVVDDLSKFPGATWFEGARLNFAENLLCCGDGRTAIVQCDESGLRDTLTYRDLHLEVARYREFMREEGIGLGDRVVAYMPNVSETIICMLAATSLGAVWASTGTEMGYTAVVDRLGQLDPKLLVTVDRTLYKGRTIDLRENVERISRAIPSLKRVLIISRHKERVGTSDIPNSVVSTEVLSGKGEAESVKFEQVNSNHPVYVMFSSGTTGRPKCMVQSVAGVLVNHLKELVLHHDLKPDNAITYITSPSWMMWNWVTSSLAVGSKLVVFDGNPLYPDWKTMWRIVEEEGINVLGCSASYINALRGLNAEPDKPHDLSSLREISQTGSPLTAEGFIWVYEHVKRELWFNSISGGTDINGCFFAGSPMLPVYAGELQAPALGMKVKAYDEHGNPVYDVEGELVCEEPSPSMPIFFWNDPGTKRYIESYFEHFRAYGKNVWRHGDWVTIFSDTRSAIIHGRSDATLKVKGVRIGTAEIYRVVETIPEVADSLAVGYGEGDDVQVALFVKLKEGQEMTEELKETIRRRLREEASPRHVPNLIIRVPDIPYTFNLKKVEIAVANILKGKPVTNREAIVNAECLEFYEKFAERLARGEY